MFLLISSKYEHATRHPSLDNLSVSETALLWIQDYLSCRCQRISVESGLSKTFDLTCGVLQGSCLVPLHMLFVIYASDLFRIIE